MAMVIKNNMEALNTLNTLNRNVGSASKDLEQLSSGQKINRAGDNASWYAISERMRAQIRGLSQDIANVQAGRQLLRTADGGIGSVIDNLRELKRMAIDSANDTNTDADRAIMQKEFDHRRNQINDIAATTNYNGIYLLDGRWRQSRFVTGWTNVLLPEGEIDYDPNHKVDPDSRTNGLLPAFNGTVGGVAPATLQGEQCWTSGSPNLKLFDGMTLPAELNNRGFTMACSGCNQDVAIFFQTGWEQGTARELTGNHTDGSPTFAYVVGIKGVATADELAKAIFDGVSAIPGHLKKDGANDMVSLGTKHNLRITKMGDNDYRLRKASPDLYLIDGFEGNLSGSSRDAINEESFPLILHTGTKANQNIMCNFNAMHAVRLGIHEASISTQAQAMSLLSTHNPDGTETVGALDAAIEFALGEATRVGAYISRLDHTESNLVTAEENTRSSESTIRDADMAQVMVQHTKDTVLQQSAQTMLAQANQTPSGVMALLR